VPLDINWDVNLDRLTPMSPGDISTWYKPHESGLSYVPYNNYAAFLHEGEMVLTRAQADAYRGGGSIDYNAMAAAMSAAVGSMSIGLDGETVGRVISPRVDNELGNMAYQNRYSRG